MENYDFDKISKIIDLKSSEIIQTLDECKVECNILSVKSFQEQFHDKNSLAKSFDDSWTFANLAEISEAYNIINEIPDCFPNKRKPEASSLNLNSTKQNDSINSSKSNVNDISTSLIPFNSEQMLRDFKDRHAAFKTVLQSAVEKGNLSQFKESMDKLRRSLDDLEKLVPCGFDEAVEIFDSEQVKDIEELRASIEAYIYMNKNKDLYHVAEMNDDKDLEVLFKISADLL